MARRSAPRGASWRRPARAIVTAVLVSVFAVPAVACTGDCDDSGAVTVDEIVRGVNIALGQAEVLECPAFDPGGDGLVTVDEILQAVSNALEGCPPDPPQPIFPADYRQTYSEVRDCRFSIEHGGVSIRVLANEIARQAYLDETSPLPVGSIIIKEEFDGPECIDADLIRRRAMRKETIGFDPEDGDWSWQWVELDGTITFDDKTTCIGCHREPECVARDFMCTVGNGDGRVAMVLERQPAALLSIAGTSPGDVYAVGADPGDGFGPLVLHYDGLRWQRLATGATGDLWWISVTPIDGSFFFSGDGGLVLERPVSGGDFVVHETPGDELLYGIWGESRNRLWAVGGSPEDPATSGVIWHYDGVTWQDVDLSGVRPEGIPVLFKVWGRDAEDLYAVGSGGLILHYDGVAWQEAVSNSNRPLFTVHGNADTVVASGGFIDGVMLESDGGDFQSRGAPGLPQMNGVFLSADGSGHAVGVAGAIAERKPSGWETIEADTDPLSDFHAVWVDADGGVWAVGGDLTISLSEGVLAYGGSANVGSEVLPVDPCPPGSPLLASTVSYFDDVVPLLQNGGCMSLSCHGGPFPSSGYDLRSYATSFGPGVQAGLLNECNIVPGDPNSSYLIEKLSDGPRLGQRMPNLLPPLDPNDIELLRTWILEGAVDDSPPTPTPTVTAPLPATATPTPTVPPQPTPTDAPAPTLSASCAEAGTVCTLAGTGLSQFDGDGPALARSFYYPIDVTFDDDGNPLILDWNNLRLRRLSDTGRIETIMGLDFEDFPTDGALAVDTPLHHASDVEPDGQGNLYVAGDHVPVVFRVGSDDRVFTVAGTTEYGYSGDGGPALQARLSTPFGVQPDGAGGLYISDVDAHVVRYVGADGIIWTVAGTGERGYSGDGGPATAAQLAGPARFDIDSEGNVYFCETKSHVIRRIDSEGTISTVVGTGRRGYSGDGGPATEAELDTPYDVRFAPDGKMYIADTGNHVVRRVDLDGTITTVVGDGVGGFAGDGRDVPGCRLNRPSAVAFSDDGSMWICDTSNHRVRRIARYLELHG